MKKKRTKSRRSRPGSSEKYKICPQCGGKMMKGTMEGGLSDGKHAWSCTNFPECTYLEVERTPLEQALLDALMKE